MLGLGLRALDPKFLQHIGIMETTVLYRGYIGIMEKKMETTI